MKQILLTTVLVTYSLLAFAQQCNCDTNERLHDIVDCTPIVLDNKAKIYWSYNCDSSWLTFEHRRQKKLLFSMELIPYTGRLGFSYEREYKSYFLIRNNLISGCCVPAEYYFLDKETGTEKRNIGSVLYIGSGKDIPIIVKLTSSNHNKTEVKYTSILVINANTNNEFSIPIPAGEIDKALKNTKEFYPELLFEEPVISDRILTLTYRISRVDKKTININLQKYL